MGGQECPSRDRMDGQTVVVTDGSDDVSVEFAKECCSRGASRIILGCSDLNQGNTTAAGLKKPFPDAQVMALPLSLSEDDSLQQFSNAVSAEVPNIDVLVINTRNSSNNQQIFRRPFALIFMLLPLLRKSSNGRVISVLSEKLSSVEVRDLDCAESDLEEKALAKAHLALLSATKWISRKCTGMILNSTVSCPFLILLFNREQIIGDNQRLHNWLSAL